MPEQLSIYEHQDADKKKKKLRTPYFSFDHNSNENWYREDAHIRLSSALLAVRDGLSDGVHLLHLPQATPLRRQVRGHPLPEPTAPRRRKAQYIDNGKPSIKTYTSVGGAGRLPHFLACLTVAELLSTTRSTRGPSIVPTGVTPTHPSGWGGGVISSYHTVL